MELSEYLSRIEFRGQVAVDLDCLAAIHHQHLLHIPYENLDIQLGRPLDFDLGRIFDKLVHQRRGGWCYEMNGLLGWALTEVGFDVMRMAGGVTRSQGGDATVGNHLVLAVHLEQPYVVDVGLGNGLIWPAPLRSGPINQEFRESRLEQIEDEYWRFHNYPGALPPDFDFRYAPADESLLAKTCADLQTNPESKFLQNLMCICLHPEGARYLIGRMFITFTGLQSTQRLLNSPDELARVLSDVFQLRDLPIQQLWAKVVARHDELFG